MLIEQIFYLNLDRRPDRNAWFLENMEAAGVPMEIVERVPGKDWQDYDSVTEMLEQMYKEDGFAQHLRQSSDNPRHSEDWIGYTAYVWTVSTALKRIIDSKKLTLVLHDDCSLKSWLDLESDLKRILKNANRTQDNKLFHTIQLSYDLHASILRNAVIPYDHIWNYGIQAFREDAIIYNYFSACRMLALVQGTHECLHAMESMLLEHFNNRYSFHPNDPRRFTRIMSDVTHNPSCIRDE